MANLTTARDIPVLVVSSAASSERRVNPSWSISQLKVKLESVTGIPPAAQALTLRLPDRQQGSPISSDDEDHTQIGAWLSTYVEIHGPIVLKAPTRPGNQATTNRSATAMQVASTDPATANVIPPLSSVPKYEMPMETYSSLSDTVLAYKKSHRIGRFDPHAPEIEQKKAAVLWDEIDTASHLTEITVGARCILAPSSIRRGTVAYVGLVPEIAGIGPWIGVELDEPAGKNDGSVAGKRYFDCKPQYGVFVRPERVEVGDWKVLGLEEDDDNDLDEI
ncbi:MAG: hypothetical protein Q9223_005529 [Gallowayella weberi]